MWSLVGGFFREPQRILPQNLKLACRGAGAPRSSPATLSSLSRLGQLLLDTHALLWWRAEPDHLSPAAHAAISDSANAVAVSAASGCEIATKVRLGKLPPARELLDDLPGLLAAQGFQLVPITWNRACMPAATRCPTATPLIVCWPPRLSWPG